MNNKIKINESIIKKIGKLADEFGIDCYVVGGYVRDYYLKRERKDIDFTVVGDSIKFAHFVADKLGTKAVIFQRFRTAMVPYKHYQFEFVGTRKEEYLPNSRKPIVKEGTLEDDLRRRDFTINALAVKVNSKHFGQVIDLFGGIEDINIGIIRTPLDPEITYSDDPLRMMRAARFASQIGFQLHNDSYEAIRKMADRIKIISQERISDEFLKILASPKPSIGLEILYDTNLLALIFPELHNLLGVDTKEDGTKLYAHKDVLLHSFKVLDNITYSTDNIWLRFAALVHDIAKPKTKRFGDNGWTFHGHEEMGARMMASIFKRMKFPLENLEYVEKLIRLHQRPMHLVDSEITDSAIRRLAFNAGDALEDLFVLCRADITTKNPYLTTKYLKNYDLVAAKVIDIQEKDKLREFQSPVCGEEIMEICSLPPSKPIGIIKSHIENAILDGIIPNDYDAAMEFFLKNKITWLKQIKKDDFKKISKKK